MAASPSGCHLIGLSPISSHSHRHPAPSSSPPIFLLPPRRAGCPRAHRLPAGETPSVWRVPVGPDCGNGGVLPERACLPRLPPPQPQQRNPVWRARAVLCLCEFWHSPLREASPDFKELKLGLIFEGCQRVSQPTPKPPQRISQIFSPRDPQS
jgi:hypothetical protein